MSKRYFCNISECIKLMLNPETNSKNTKNILKDKQVKYIKFSEEFLEKISENNFENSNENIKKLYDYIENNLGSFYRFTDKQLACIFLLVDITKVNLKEENIKYQDFKNAFVYGDSIIKALVKKNVFCIYEKSKEYNEYDFLSDEIEIEEDKILNEEQENVFQKIKEKIEEEEYSENLIFGVTGSRKD